MKLKFQKLLIASRLDRNGVASLIAEMALSWFRFVRILSGGFFAALETEASDAKATEGEESEDF